MAVEIEVDLSDAIKGVEDLRSQLANRRALNAALGKRAEVELRAHFTDREQGPSKASSRGWPKQHFWAQIAQATTLTEVNDDGATVTINDPRFAQKVYGGTIKPGAGKKYLTIPAIAQAYGRSAQIIEGLKPIIRMIAGERRAVALGKGETVISKKGNPRLKPGTETIWYWLVKSVTQEPDPQALPPMDHLKEKLQDEAKEYLARP